MKRTNRDLSAKSDGTFEIQYIAPEKEDGDAKIILEEEWKKLQTEAERALNHTYHQALPK